MALREYITIADVDNDIFSRFSDTTKQKYVDEANEECEDLAKRRGISDPADITDTTHFKLRQYLTHYAIAQLAQAKIGFQNKDAFQGEDKYESLFKREQYILQNLKPDITLIIFTGGEETPLNRAVQSQVVYRG